MPKTKRDESDPNSVYVTVKVKRRERRDPFGRERPERVRLRVTHHDGYGVLVSGSVLGGIPPEVARRALRAVGYTEVDGLPYRPCQVDQKPSAWPLGLAVGGIPAVAFYFSPRS